MLLDLEGMQIRPKRERRGAEGKREREREREQGSARCRLETEQEQEGGCKKAPRERGRERSRL